MTGSERDAKKYSSRFEPGTLLFFSLSKSYMRSYITLTSVSLIQIVKFNDLGTRLMNYPSPESALHL